MAALGFPGQIIINVRSSRSRTGHTVRGGWCTQPLLTRHTALEAATWLLRPDSRSADATHAVQQVRCCRPLTSRALPVRCGQGSPSLPHLAEQRPRAAAIRLVRLGSRSANIAPVPHKVQVQLARHAALSRCKHAPQLPSRQRSRQSHAPSLGSCCWSHSCRCSRCWSHSCRCSQAADQQVLAPCCWRCAARGPGPSLKRSLSDESLHCCQADQPTSGRGPRS